MGQIQSGINQIIGQAGALAHLSPEWRAKAEKRAALKDIGAREKNLAKSRESVLESAKAGLGEYIKEKDPIKEQELAKGLKYDFEQSDIMRAQSLKLAQEKYNLDPTSENYEALKTASFAQSKAENAWGDFFDEWRSSAEQNLDPEAVDIADKQIDKAMKVMSDRVRRAYMQRDNLHNLMNALKDEDFRVGDGSTIKIKDTNPEIQQQIASSLTKEERLELLRKGGSR